jgi:hypothetical protein
MPDPRKKSSYGPVLLALGNYAEERNWRDICVLEVEGGMIVQGTGLVQTAEGYQYVVETKMFSHDELAKLIAHKK